MLHHHSYHLVKLNGKANVCVSQATMAPTAQMPARWSPVSTSQRAPGSLAPNVVTPATVPGTTLAPTARKSTLPLLCKTILMRSLLSFACCVSHQWVWYNKGTCTLPGPTCRVPEAGGVTRHVALVIVKRRRASTLTATRRAENVAARWEQSSVTCQSPN